jgi:hypothetical protein
VGKKLKKEYSSGTGKKRVTDGKRGDSEVTGREENGTTTTEFQQIQLELPKVHHVARLIINEDRAKNYFYEV